VSGSQADDDVLGCDGDFLSHPFLTSFLNLKKKKKKKYKTQKKKKKKKE